MFDVISFCLAHNLRFSPASEPWVAVSCPWCGDESSKGGNKLYGAINTVSEVYTCFRCGGKHINAYIRKVAPKGTDVEQEAWKWRHGAKPDQSNARAHASALKMPISGAFTAFHSKYVSKRGFDPEKLIHTYGLAATGPGVAFKSANGKTFDLSWRIVIPMRDSRGNTVSWQARAISKEASLRYVGCPDEDSIASYKDLLYGSDMARRDVVGVVEGVVDQWRMGPGWVATLGTGVTPKQIKALSQWKRVVVCFDSEPLAQRHAMEIAANLAAIGVRCDVVDLELGDKDPGDLTEQEAREIGWELGF